MKSMTQKFLALSLLISLPGCFDFGCCKKETPAAVVEETAHQATPTEHCSHAGCTHGHNAEVTEEAQACHHEGCTENHATQAVVNTPCGNAACTHKHNEEAAAHEEVAAETELQSDEK